MKRYNISQEDRQLFESWVASDRPSFAPAFIIPVGADVGLDSLVFEIRENAGKARGFVDSRDRHFISAVLPCAVRPEERTSVSERQIAAILDAQWHAASVTNFFAGVFLLDVTPWSGREFSGPYWDVLAGMARTSEETAFGAILRTNLPGEAEQLAKKLSAALLTDVRTITLLPPTVEQLVEEYHRLLSESSQSGSDGGLREWIESILESGDLVGYELPRRLCRQSRLLEREIEHMELITKEGTR